MPKGGASSEFPIKNFLGLNLKDSSDLIRDNEFTLLKNVFRSSQGVFQKRWGTALDVSSIPLASRISGVWRHYTPSGKNISIYHCVPDSTLFPDNTADLVLADVASADGIIFGGAAVSTLRVCYSWIGSGIEQTYNSRTRAGFPAVGSFPLNASANPAHQTITLGANTNKLQVTVPAFPTGVRGANIFVARGTDTQMNYVGTVTTSGGSLVVSSFICAAAAKLDALTAQEVTAVKNNGGLLTPGGTYWVSFAWVVNNDIQEGSDSFGGFMPLSAGQSPIYSLIPSDSNTSGSLSSATQYDYLLSLTDGSTGKEVYASAISSFTTGSGKTAISFLTPPIPGWATPGSTWNIYFGTHSGTLYIAKSGLGGNVTYVQTTVPASGTQSPSPFGPGPVEPYAQQITLGGGCNAISVSAPASASSNGAKSVYVFIGTQSPNIQPMTCVGTLNVGTYGNPGVGMTILSIPSHNAQSSPVMTAADVGQPVFSNHVNDSEIGGLINFVGSSAYNAFSRFQGRYGFLMAKDKGGSLREIFPSRTLLDMAVTYGATAVYAGDVAPVTHAPNLINLHNFTPWIKTPNDLNQNATDFATPFSQPFAYDTTPNDPMFCYFNGITYFANGADIPWQADGYTLGQLACVQAQKTGVYPPTLQTQLPPIPRYIFEYQGSLVVAGAKAGNQLYASNANAPQNWATGGAGKLMRFVTIGDALGSGITAIGIFTPITEATNNPGSFMVAFKKNGSWMINTIPDPVSTQLAGTVGNQISASMLQVSGRVGCVAYRSIVQTPLGTMFLGQDGNVYIINRVAEPMKVGTKVQNLLSHLVSNDDWMKMVTAVYHDNHYKLSYPSVAATQANPVVNDSELWADLRTEGGTPIVWVGPHAGRSIGPQVVLVGDNDDLSRLAADGGSVRTLVCDSKAHLDDLGSNIVSQIQSKIYRFSEEGHIKRIFGALLDVFLDMGYTNDLLFEGFADADYQAVNKHVSSGGGVWDSSQWDQSNYADALWAGIACLFGGTNLTGRTFQWRLTHSNQAPFLLSSATLLLKAEKRRIA